MSNYNDDQEPIPLPTEGLCADASKTKKIAINTEMEERRAVGRGDEFQPGNLRRLEEEIEFHHADVENRPEVTSKRKDSVSVHFCCIKTTPKHRAEPRRGWWWGR